MRSKFHARIFVLFVGAVEVYVVQECMLAIYSNVQYSENNNSFANECELRKIHLTNICIQDVTSEETRRRCMRLIDEESVLQDVIVSKYCKTEDEAKEILRRIKDKINDQVAQIAEAVISENGISLAPNCFELFGFDFLVRNDSKVLFLEANAQPDIAQPGETLQPRIDQMLRDTIRLVVDKTSREDSEMRKRMKQVFAMQR